MVTQTQSFPRCTAQFDLLSSKEKNDVPMRDRLKSIDGACAEIFLQLEREIYMGKHHITEIDGKVFIQFVPEKKEVYSFSARYPSMDSGDFYLSHLHIDSYMNDSKISRWWTTLSDRVKNGKSYSHLKVTRLDDQKVN